MNRVTIKKNTNPHDVWLTTPGTYRKGRAAGSRRVVVTISCPKCRKAASLSSHSIEPNGNVSPSVVCPSRDCDWHEWITLEGWK